MIRTTAPVRGYEASDERQRLSYQETIKSLLDDGTKKFTTGSSLFSPDPALKK